MAKKFDHDAAGLPFRQLFKQSIEGLPVCLARKEPVTIDKVEQRHRLAAQRMDDMPVIDDLVVLARGMGPPARQRHEMGAADEDIEPVIVEAHPEPVSNQARGHGVEYLAEREAAGGCDAHADLLIVRRAPVRQILQFGALNIDTFCVAGILATDNLIDETAIGGESVEIAPSFSSAARRRSRA